jgi:hypothetical protein
MKYISSSNAFVIGGDSAGVEVVRCPALLPARFCFPSRHNNQAGMSAGRYGVFTLYHLRHCPAYIQDINAKF